MKDRIYQLMKQQGMSQKEFSNELCIAEGTLSSIFSGRTKASNNIVFSIHERFPDISIPWLMFGEGEMYGTSTATPSSQDKAAVDQNTPSTDAPLSDLFQQGSPHPTCNIPVKEVTHAPEKPQRKIVEIRVFFDDGTYQTFQG